MKTSQNKILEIANKRFDEYFYDSSHILKESQVKHLKVSLFIPEISKALTTYKKELLGKLKRPAQIGLMAKGYNQAIDDIDKLLT